MIKNFTTVIGSFLLITCLAGPAGAEAIRYDFAMAKIDGSLTAMANVSWRLEEAVDLIIDCDNPPCISFYILPALDSSAATVIGNRLMPYMLFRSWKYHDNGAYGKSVSPSTEYYPAGGNSFLPIDMQEGTNNVLTLWKVEDESTPITVYDSILMFLFGISFVIGLIGNNSPQAQRKRPPQKRKRNVHKEQSDTSGME